jgi:hypothetical protein
MRQGENRSLSFERGGQEKWDCLLTDNVWHRFYLEVSTFRLESPMVAAGSQYFWFCTNHMGMMEGWGCAGIQWDRTTATKRSEKNQSAASIMNAENIFQLQGRDYGQ